MSTLSTAMGDSREEYWETTLLERELHNTQHAVAYFHQQGMQEAMPLTAALTAICAGVSVKVHKQRRACLMSRNEQQAPQLSLQD